MYVLIVATLVLISNWALEYYRHLRYVNAIPIRIHVNGTRGKSSLTRLISSGLRAGNLVTVGKTTGTLPRILLPDGKESSIVRLMGANIIEQKYIFRYAASLKPDAIVIECMAVNPAYQWITERKFVRSTIGVITNARPDHLDLMGSTVQSVTMCLSNTIPNKGVCFTAEDEQFHLMKRVAKSRNTDIYKIRPVDVTDEEMEKFSYIEHKDNVQLALAVCQRAGISREVALKGMQSSNPDPGALKKYSHQTKDKKYTFYNVFAANDPSSTEFIYNMVTKNLNGNITKILILNNRADRFFRSQQLVDICHNIQYDYLILTGEICDKVFNYAIQEGLPQGKVLEIGQIPMDDLYKKISNLVSQEGHVIGIGNIADKAKYGASIVKHFKNKSNGKN
ncbi:MAG TPA: poly-gamma-glutamate synthase PgsB [Candidatus Cloacimonadota bacterium]|nr:poly-gamma-glutamate synthase PgsB [Candidatus Cloacimonadota bacterium]HQB41319.1 poly-gamma-glutamate synthase PgsB [Candidatus Cloacimonadota bacterium]